MTRLDAPVEVRRSFSGRLPVLDHTRLAKLLAGFPDLRIGLVGDLFLDRYLDIDPALSEISIETGLEAYQVTRIRNYPGALGTVINNLAALGVGRLVPVTVLGDDGQAFDLVQELARLPVDVGHILRDAARVTPTYTKPMKQDKAGAWRELNRLDLRNRAPLSKSTENMVLDHLTAVFVATDGLIVLDQVNEEGWGVVGPRVRAHLKSLAKAAPDKLMFVDSRAQIDRFDFGVLKPNLPECLRALGRDADAADVDPLEVAGSMAQRRGCAVYCTLGPRGIVVANPGEIAVLVPALHVEGPIDIVGAGDSATAGIVSSLLVGARAVEAAAVGNLVASITIQQIGVTGTATPEQVLARHRDAVVMH